VNGKDIIKVINNVTGKVSNHIGKGIDKLQVIADKYDPRKDGSNGEEVIIHGASYQRYGSPYFWRKKHYCRKCNALLAVKKTEKVVNSFSEEAKNYDFYSFDTYLVGNIKFVTYYFECPECKTIYENIELLNIERQENKIRRKEKINELKTKLQEKLRR